MEIKPVTIRKSVVYPAIFAAGVLCSCSGQQPKQPEPPVKEQPPMRLAGSMPPPAPKSPTSKDKKKQADKGPRQQQPPQRMPGKKRSIP